MEEPSDRGRQSVTEFRIATGQGDEAILRALPPVPVDGGTGGGGQALFDKRREAGCVSTAERLLPVQMIENVIIALHY